MLSNSGLFCRIFIFDESVFQALLFQHFIWYTKRPRKIQWHDLKVTMQQFGGGGAGHLNNVIGKWYINIEEIRRIFWIDGLEDMVQNACQRYHQASPDQTLSSEDC